ncbi:hypothetical protein GCM10023212_05570 [Luteolibacter yonseiensis]
MHGAGALEEFEKRKIVKRLKFCESHGGGNPGEPCTDFVHRAKRMARSESEKDGPTEQIRGFSGSRRRRISLDPFE